MAEPAGQNEIMLGNIRVVYLPDGYARFDKARMFPKSSPESWQLHQEWLGSDGRVPLSVGGFLVQTGARNILVDTGYGDRQKEIPGLGPFVGGSLLDSLRKAGLEPEEIDTVVYTHLHSDHAGWTSRKVNDNWELTFSNASHLLMATEWEFWQEDGHADLDSLERVLQPLENHTEFISDGQVIAPGINVLHTPGHTPGHQAIVVSSGEQRLVILGDIVHCPVQFDAADWATAFDVDPVLARKTLERMQTELENPGTIGGGGHFPEIVFGRLLQAQGKRQWTTL